MNAALSQLSAAQLHADALRASLRNPPPQVEPTPDRRPPRRSPLYRLRPALV